MIMKAILSAVFVGLSFLAGASFSPDQPQCPAGYDRFLRDLCQDSNTGHIVEAGSERL
jgi:hypothetical protein